MTRMGSPKFMSKNYDAILINDTGGMTRGLERGMNVTVKANVLTDSVSIDSYRYWYPEVQITSKIKYFKEDEETETIVGIVYDNINDLRGDIEDVLEVIRPSIIILCKLHKELFKKDVQFLIDYFERDQGYAICGVDYLQTKDEYRRGDVDKFKMSTYYYGLPVDDDEFYMICFDKDKYSDYITSIRDMHPHTRALHPHHIYSLEDIIDPEITDKELFLSRKKMGRINQCKDPDLVILNNEVCAPCLREPNEADNIAVVVRAVPDVEFILQGYPDINKERYRYLSCDEFAVLKGLKGYGSVISTPVGEEDLFKWNVNTSYHERVHAIVASPSVLTVEYLARQVDKLLGGMNI